MKLLPASSSVIVLLACLSGCGSWNPFSKPDPKTAPAELQAFTPSMAVKKVWSVSIGGAGEYSFNPVAVGSSIYAASNDGSVVKIDANSGQVAWKVRADVNLTAGVGANEKAVVVGGQKGLLLAYDTRGKLRWKMQASSEILAAPVVSDNVVLVHTIDNRVAAYDVENGSNKWTLERPLPILTLRVATGIAVKDQMAYISTPGGKLLSVALQNGGLRWEVSAAEPKGATELERVVDMSGAPAIVSGNVCAATYQGRVGCFDLSNGSNRWNKEISSEVGVAADERFVFAADNQGAVSGFALNGGANVWKNDKLKRRDLSTPVSFGRAVVVGDRFGFVHFLSREDGVFIARMPTDGSKVVSAPLIVGNNLVVQTKSGTVVAFATE
ncbi:outer membrane protein assembly factor BamB [Undibacterium cyanobacteriorum]|uniref:Outer membrane protein assembly factor BamB n=1 Tax=Undibacterium cyanobacteriorum TaxID=3073561 RepID=A0ABY9RM50_9BURK|nr:outer membrane protein assembly factor BamB [Undibacterium sp. 20NA77.5]WMW82292.1 outer membrane protein assembly factor BamB [Undibacterium sp. 20NA77.5]